MEVHIRLRNSSDIGLREILTSKVYQAVSLRLKPAFLLYCIALSAGSSCFFHTRVASDHIRLSKEVHMKRDVKCSVLSGRMRGKGTDFVLHEFEDDDDPQQRRSLEGGKHTSTDTRFEASILQALMDDSGSSPFFLLSPFGFPQHPKICFNSNRGPQATNVQISMRAR